MSKVPCPALPDEQDRKDFRDLGIGWDGRRRGGGRETYTYKATYEQKLYREAYEDVTTPTER